MSRSLGDHPHTDPGDGRTECSTCGKWIFPSIHSCKGVPVTAAAIARHAAWQPVPVSPTERSRRDRLAAALRREAHETLHQIDGLHYSNDITEERRQGAHALLARADRLDGSGDGQES